jgi:HEAT repeat protein
MPVFIVAVVIAVIIVWWMSGQRALSRNERMYLKRRGYAVEGRAENERPVERDTRLLSVIDSLSDISPFSRQRAAEDISQMCMTGRRDERMFSALVSALDDSQPAVRSAVVAALGNLGDRRAIETLTRRLEDEEAIQVRAAVRQALSKLGAND